MEKLEQKQRTKDEITAEIRGLEQEIIGLEEGIPQQHEEVGTSVDDSGQEAAADDTKLALLRMSIEDKRRRIDALRKELEQAA